MQPKPLANYRFYRRPFVILATGLSIGILLGFDLREWTDLSFLFTLIVLSGSLVLYILRRLKGIILFTCILMVTILTGIHLIQSRDGAWDPYVFSQVYQRGDPMVVELKEVGTGDKTWKKMTGNVRGLVKSEKILKVNEPVVLFVKTDNFGCEPGDLIAVYSEPQKIKNSGNPGEFDAEFYWNRKGFRHMMFVGEHQFKVLKNVGQSWIRRTLNGLNEYLGQSLEDNLSGKELAIAKALILGDKSLLDTEVKNSFTNTGAMHVLAVSGLHVGIIMQILMVFFGFFSKWMDRRTSILLVVGIMWIYAVLTGFSPSVLRAVFMFSVLVLAQISGKQHDSVNSLFFTAFVIFLFDPYTLFDIGFQLSFLAMLGIFLFYRQIEEVVFIENKWIRKVWQGTAIGFAAQIMTTPLSLYYFHQFPNYFILTNIGLMASSGLILGLGIFIFSISWLKLLAKFAGLILGLIIYLSLLFIEWVERLPGAVAYGFEVSILVVLFMGILALILFTVMENRKLQYVAFAMSGLLLISLVYRRYLNLDRDEVCIFNHKKLVVAVKKDAQIVCFYRGDKDDLEKIKFICEGYRKLHPGEIRYVPLDKVNYTAQLGEDRFTIKRTGNDYELSIGERKMIIAFGDNSSALREGNVIGMPWVTENIDHNLGDGAYLLTF